MTLETSEIFGYLGNTFSLFFFLAPIQQLRSLIKGDLSYK
jgi:hypothetical protein